MDLKDCFHTIPLVPQDKEEFAFTVPALNVNTLLNITYEESSLGHASHSTMHQHHDH
jgi:hypothetical protein